MRQTWRDESHLTQGTNAPVVATAKEKELDEMEEKKDAN